MSRTTTCCVLILLSWSVSTELLAQTIVELPRPNSGTFTTEEARHRQSEIFLLHQTEMLTDWENPYFGFAIHITKEDEIIVYQSFLEKGKMSVQNVAQLLQSYGDFLEGNPLGILLTCERDPKSSAVIGPLMKELFTPWIQVFYVRSK